MIQSADNREELERLSHQFQSWSKYLDEDGMLVDEAMTDCLVLRRCWIDMAGDHAGGLMLAQIAYWILIPSKKGQTKLRVHRHGSLWLAKSHRDWWNECRLSRCQVQRLLAKFEKNGWIETKTMRFNGAPTTHIRLRASFLHSWKHAILDPGNYPS